MSGERVSWVPDGQPPTAAEREAAADLPSLTFYESGPPDLIVIRLAPDLPPGAAPQMVDGLWLDRADLPVAVVSDSGTVDGQPAWVAVATGRYEVRADGATAEVVEARP